jgi:anti-anti-sigma regulatory factor
MQRIWGTDGDLLLDLSEVGMFGSAAVAILVAADAEIRARGGRLVIVDAPPDVAQLLVLVGVPRPPSAAGASVPARTPAPTPVS